MEVSIVEREERRKQMKEQFEDFLCQRGDEIDNAAFDALYELSGRKLEWDISMIRELVEYAKQLLKDKEISFCDPYYETSDGEHSDEFSEGMPCAIKGCENCKECLFNNPKTHVLLDITELFDDSRKKHGSL